MTTRTRRMIATGVLLGTSAIPDPWHGLRFTAVVISLYLIAGGLLVPWLRAEDER